MTDKISSSTNVTALRKRQETEKERQERDEKDLIAVLSTVEGRRFIKTILASCYEHRSVFHTNALTMAHMEGARNFGLSLKHRIVKAAPQHIVELLTND